MNISPRLQALRTRDLTRAGEPRRAGGRVEVASSGDGFLYRPAELLLGRGAVDQLRSEVGRSAVSPDEETNARFEARGVDVQRWHVGGGVRVPELRTSLQGKVRGRGSHVELNHVLTGEWFYRGGPANTPTVASSLPLPQTATLPSQRARLAVLDTGVTDPAHQYFSDVLVHPGTDDVDLLDEDGDSVLDSEAGHGTFICGLVQRVAPGLAMEQRKVLSSLGFGDDLTVALGVAETEAAVLNLSLGGYTYGDRAPAALQAALCSLSPDRVVVAAAGNNGLRRKFWPAAFSQVIAVGAYDSATGQPAPFSNCGDWVDVCAPGVELHSCYVDGQFAAGEEPFSGWAAWSGTSFAAPLVAAEIARRAALTTTRTAAQVATDLLEELGPRPADGYGRRYTPPMDLRFVTDMTTLEVDAPSPELAQQP